MNNELLLSVIIAVQYSQDNLEDILLNLNPLAYTNVEFLFCATNADADTESMVSRFDNCHVITSTDGSLIPEMWRDGIKTAQSNKVALSTAHCIPAKNWVETLLATNIQMYPGIGGVIKNDITANAKDWAIFFLRYISFAPPQQSRELSEIAADNAVYRRDEILECSDLLVKGFWEPSFHERFRKKNMTLFLAPNLVVTHKNLYTTVQFFQQRLAHGNEFGQARISEISTIKRLVLIFLSPVLPFLFLKKIIVSVIQNGIYTTKLPKAIPWLLVFLLAWGLGEAKGYLSINKI